jgi:predicted dehydrogenase
LASAPQGDCVMRVLIIGQGGIGQLYTKISKELAQEVVTIDSQPGLADYAEFSSDLGVFDLAVIATPNFTHEAWARKTAAYSKIVLVEKPGVVTADAWRQLHEDFSNTRFIMVKNNQWRDNIRDLKYLAKNSRYINILWLNKNRIPNPGSHFTTKSMSFGGVSRDLMPHLLSLYAILADDYLDIDRYQASAEQQHQLADIHSTDYGVINPDGVYDVDDLATIKITNYKFPAQRQDWLLQCDWANGEEDRQVIEFYQEQGYQTIELGLCPDQHTRL